MPSCYSCKKEVLIVGTVGRRDVCEHCDTDLHCCRNCGFYDTSSYNECHEISAMRVMDKEKSNFCEFFKMAGKPFDNKKETDDARQKLEALFKKKSD